MGAQLGPSLERSITTFMGTDEGIRSFGHMSLRDMRPQLVIFIERLETLWALSLSLAWSLPSVFWRTYLIRSLILLMDQLDMSLQVLICPKALLAAFF